MGFPTGICIVKELMASLLLLENTLHFQAFYLFLPESEIFSLTKLLYNQNTMYDFFNSAYLLNLSQFDNSKLT